jgi:hypothetical protein
MVIDEVEFPVEEGKVREFAIAVGNGDTRSVSLTFCTVAGHWRDQAAMVKGLELDLPRIVVGAAEWEYCAPVTIGDRLRGKRIVTAVDHKQGSRGTITMVTLETRFHGSDGQLAVIQRDTVIELPE